MVLSHFIIDPQTKQFRIDKNVDIKFSVRDAFLEKPSSDTLKMEKLESQLIECFGSNKYTFVYIDLAKKQKVTTATVLI
jgi:hypothetical protein